MTSTSCRRVLTAAALATMVVGVLLACDDATVGTAPVTDDWAEGSAVVLQMRSELTFFGNGRPLPVGPVAHVRADTIRPFSIDASGVKAAWNRTDAGQPRVYHVRVNGEWHSFGFVSDNDGKPKRVYGFRNGKIQFVYSPSFRRAGTSWIRVRSRLTVFDSSGTPISQINTAPANSVSEFQLRSSRVGQTTTGAISAADVTSAHALGEQPAEAEGTEGDCGALRFRAGVKGAAFAAATFTAIAAAANCVAKPDQLTCALAIAAGIAAVNAWDSMNAAIDALTQCELDEWIRKTNGPGIADGGGPPAPYSPTPPPPQVDSRLLTVPEFIAQAEAEGAYWCSGDGNYCVYYAE